MRPSVRHILVSTALLLASAASGQESPPEAGDSSEIVVTGAREREEQVRQFVRALTPPAGGGSIPRFIDELCPYAVGLMPAQNQRVVARLRQIAAAAGLKVAGSGCAPNAFVVVTADKRGFIERLAEERPGWFGSMSGRQVRSLARSPGPAAAWQLAGPVNQNGVPLRFDETLGVYMNRTTEGGSRIRSSGGVGFDASAMVVESGALAGLTATQLADYAAMRLFAKLDPARLPAPPPPTILTLLDTPIGRPVPITMTRWDLGLLRGLYGSSANLNVGAQRSQIAREVNKGLSGAER
jgi:hypothetical protein